MNKNQIILFGSLAVVIIAAILLILGVLPGIKQNVSTAQADLIFWSFDDSPDIWNQIISVYSAANPGIKITYVQKNTETFEEELLNTLASGKAPDMWTIRDSWILKHKNKVFPLPEISLQFTKNDFQKLFADAAFSFIQDQQIIALPLSVDTLALYYNKDIFNSENIPNPPSTWDDLLITSQKTTKRSLSGEIIQSGVALGTVKNIERAVDILSSLFLQNNVVILDPETKKSDLGSTESINALEFYRSFSDTTKKNFSWSDAFQNSFDAFANEKVAVVFGLAKDYERVKAKNPRLNFGISPLPQQKGSSIKTNYGIVSGITVSRNAKSPLEAWRFLIYATANQNALKFYLNATSRPPAYRQYVTADFLPPYLQTFREQVLSADSWLQPDEKAVSTIFQNMIQSARGSAISISTVLGAAGGQLEKLLSQ